MKAVILAGDFGARPSETTSLIPRPVAEVGDKFILWHIIKTYNHCGINDFMICCDCKQCIIKEYFASYFRHNSDMTVDLPNNTTTILDNRFGNWEVAMVDTGSSTQTGGRIRRIQKYLGNERFLLAYSDGVIDLSIGDTPRTHGSSGYLLSLTAHKLDGKFGALQLDLDTDRILSSREKPDGDRNWINTGYFVCEPEVFDCIPEDDPTIFERQPLESIAKAGRIHTFRHTGFQKPMDTPRGNTELNETQDQGVAL